MKKMLLIAGAVALASCTESPKLAEPQGLAYVASHPVRLDVERVEVVKEYRMPRRDPYVDHKMPVPPVALIQQWTQDRILPVGKGSYAVVTILDASVKEVALPRSSGMSSWFKLDQTDRYDANFKIKVEVFDTTGKRRGYAEARAQGSQSVLENMTLGQRRQVWVDLVEKAMNQLDQEMVQNMKSHMRDFVAG